MGPLAGVRVVELAGLAPGPFACMVLADLGADVLRIDRQGDAGFTMPPGVLDRGRRTVALNLKKPEAVDVLGRLVESADVFVEGFRPGVAERLGIGPDELLARNARLIYGRMTGWGQDGPLAARAGHDINYIAVAGALQPIGRSGEPPVPPLNLIADFAGGGLLLAAGIMAALVERERSGRGQVVDAAMVDGAALLTTFLYGMHAAGLWSSQRASNWFDGAAPFYDTYETADGQYVAVGAFEPQFFAELVTRLGIADEDLPAHLDPDGWPLLKQRLVTIFKQRTRDEWTEIFADTDACVSPVLSPWEAAAHPHNQARETFVDVGGTMQPAPAPRFSRTPTAQPRPVDADGRDVEATLADWGIAADEAAQLRAAGTVG